MRIWLLFICLCSFEAFGQQTFFVATTGNNALGDGSAAQPWATITHALDNVPDNSLILVKPGTYNGRIRIRGSFNQGVTIRSEIPYQAKLRAAEAVLTIYNDNANIEGINIEGFDIAHTGAGAAALVVQIQDGFATETRRLILRDNILHDSFNNDILKINNGASEIQVIGNLFYNQNGSDEHIDINSVDNVTVEGNVFFNNFSASGRTNNNDTSSYVVVKDSNAGDDEYLGARNVQIKRNIFLNWEGSTGSGFLLFGEDGTANFEAFNCLVENNLLIGNSVNTQRSPLGVKGARDIVYRHNTVVGDQPANAFVTRINREGDNPQIEAIRFAHNIFSDPNSSMQDFSDTIPADLSTARPSLLQRNLYYNGGNALPNDNADALNIIQDVNRLESNPLLPAQSNVQTPHWLSASNVFNGGYARIIDVFLAYANTYGVPATGSPALGAATVAADIPSQDLLGRVRSNPAALGCCERDSATIFVNGFEN